MMDDPAALHAIHPLGDTQWYCIDMSDTQAVVVGNKGRVVVPASLRTRHRWSEGSMLVAVDTEYGVLLADRAEVERFLRERLAGTGLLGELVAERRATARAEDA